MTNKPNLDQFAQHILKTVQPFLKPQPTFAAWTLGRLIVEEAQRSGQAWTISEWEPLAEALTENDLPISPNKLKKLCELYRTFPDWSQLFPELSFTHYQQLLQLKPPARRTYYLQQAAANHWSTRELNRQIKARSFERTHTREPTDTNTEQEPSIAQLIKDTYVLEFIQSPTAMLERDLEQALLDQLQFFLLELGQGFAFIARQKRIVTESGKQFFIDLVFYHVLRKCFVLIDLKIGELSHRDIGQMDMYVRLYDDKYRSPEDAPSAGIILCTEKDHTLVKYSMLRESERLFASTYILYLPDDDG